MIGQLCIQTDGTIRICKDGAFYSVIMQLLCLEKYGHWYAVGLGQRWQSLFASGEWWHMTKMAIEQ
jgi:hypothetical protein